MVQSYPAPIVTPVQTVAADWIDYNGHMNVAYYTMAIDRAVECLLEHLGLGEAYAAATRNGPYALQSNIHYLGEMLEGASFHANVILLDHDAKRMHMSVEIISDGEVKAICEQMLINVDLNARRSAAYASDIQERMGQMLSDHADLTRPVQIGASIGIRRKG